MKPTVGVIDIRKVYDAADSPPAVSWELFKGRIQRILGREDEVTEQNVHDALHLSPDEYKEKYGTRRTKVEIDGRLIDITKAYFSYELPNVVYRTFWQRIKRLQKANVLDQEAMRTAAYADNAEWITFYGGGRRRKFIYSGDVYPEYRNHSFSSTTAFLRIIGKYDERATIWSRLKNGWELDEALIEPVLPLQDRTGLIYLVKNTKTALQYVGLTRMTTEQRWRHHLRVALENNAQTALAIAIRTYGANSFSIQVLEQGLNQNELPEREVYWIKELNTLVPNGLNTRSGGQMGSGKGKKIEYQSEVFYSIESAAATLSKRTGIAKHVIVSRLVNGKPLPDQPRVKSDHPEAGSNMWRRWKSLLNALVKGKRSGQLSPEWLSYDVFASDVRPGYKPDLRLARIDVSAPWGPTNFQWLTRQEIIESSHGNKYVVFGKKYGSLNAVAREYLIGRSTLRNRIEEQGMTIEEAITKELSVTSKSQSRKTGQGTAG